jgi:predicted amidohydrolase YtcJ
VSGQDGAGGVLLRDVVVRGARVDVRAVRGRIEEVAPGLASAPGEAVLDGGGGALLPGLHDHHVHLLATAARAGSLDVGPEVAPDAAALAARLRAAADRAGPDGWVRAVGYDEATAGLLERAQLDAMVGAARVRVQDRTGALWALSSAALDAVLAAGPDGALPDGLERDAAGLPTGRLWRAGAWLGARVPATPPDLAAVGRALARAGVTGLTDASVTTGPEEVALLTAAVARGDLPQRLRLLSGGPLPRPGHRRVRVGPVKVVLDDARLPPPGAVAAAIASARAQRRAVAVHCVTVAELVVALAALDEVGPVPGDRIEHAGVVLDDLVGELARRGLTVVTQPGFVLARGDRWLRHVDPRDRPHLYRCRSLLAAGVPVGAGSDAPFGPIDPWVAVRAAVDRTTAAGAVVGAAEALTPARALGLWLGMPARPGGRRRQVRRGASADLCLLRRDAGSPTDAASPGGLADPVAATLVGGEVVALDDPARLNWP